jgi:transaldolase
VADHPLLQVRALGQSLWLDDMRREMLDNAELAWWIAEQGLTGTTSNPSMFEKDIVERRAYDGEIAALSGRAMSAADIYEHMAVEDIRRASDLFADTFRQTAGRDGLVSLEGSPHLAHDADKTVAEARRLWERVGRPNVMIKVPGTAAGLSAVESLTAQGIHVHVTLLFSLDRYRQVAEHYLRGLERRQAAGRPLDEVASVASFFLSRIDTRVDRWLDRRAEEGGPDAALSRDLRGETAVASARLAYEIYGSVFQAPRWEALCAVGARPQRLLWASTSTEDPMYSDVKYVEALIGPDTVNALPLETLQAFRDHGRPAGRLQGELGRARWVLASLARLGLDLAEVTRGLEAEGLRQSATSFDHLLQALQTRREVVAG